MSSSKSLILSGIALMPLSVLIAVAIFAVPGHFGGAGLVIFRLDILAFITGIILSVTGLVLVDQRNIDKEEKAS